MGGREVWMGVCISYTAVNPLLIGQTARSRYQKPDLCTTGISDLMHGTRLLSQCTIVSTILLGWCMRIGYLGLEVWSNVQCLGNFISLFMRVTAHDHPSQAYGTESENNKWSNQTTVDECLVELQNRYGLLHLDEDSVVVSGSEGCNPSFFIWYYSNRKFLLLHSPKDPSEWQYWSRWFSDQTFGIRIWFWYEMCDQVLDPMRVGHFKSKLCNLKDCTLICIYNFWSILYLLDIKITAAAFWISPLNWFIEVR